MKEYKDIREQAGIVSPKDGYPKYKVDKSNRATVNAIAQAISYELTGKSYMDPYSALTNLKVKLNTVNLDFDLPEPDSVVDEGSFSTSLKKSTSDFGKKPDTPFDEWDKDDGSTGLTMTVNIKKDEDNLYKLSATVK
tara:strand:- start:155 stop:565 length:411 start_codon:yes stop_codon:yes gene_type:complete